jgi:hypothetical protein
MPFGELKNLNLNKLLPMFPDRIVTHVPGLDQVRNRSLTVPAGHSMILDWRGLPSRAR